MDEDMILPDDFTEDTIPTDETPEETLEETTETPQEEPVEDTIPTEEPETPAPMIKIKVDHQERDISVEEAATLAQKGLNYERAVERAAKEARDAVIASMGMEWQGKPIKTEAEYQQAIMEKELMEKYQDVPEEVRNELIENRRFREKYEADQKTKADQEQKDTELKEFLDYFQSVNERPYDANKDAIPPEVWEASKGVPLKFAFIEHQNKQLQSQMKVLKQNQQNQERAPVGSVTSHGSTEVASKDDFELGFDSIE